MDVGASRHHAVGLALNKIRGETSGPNPGFLNISSTKKLYSGTTWERSHGKFY